MEDWQSSDEEDESQDSSWFDQFFSLSPLNFVDIDVLGLVSDDGESLFKKAVQLEHGLDNKPRNIHKALTLYGQAEDEGHPTARDARLRLEARLPYYKKRAIAAANVKDKLALHRQAQAAEEKKKSLEKVPDWLEKRRTIEKNIPVEPLPHPSFIEVSSSSSSSSVELAAAIVPTAGGSSAASPPPLLGTMVTTDLRGSIKENESYESEIVVKKKAANVLL
jgi:TPR repeat protein